MRPRRLRPSCRRPRGSARSSIPTRRWRGATITCWREWWRKASSPRRRRQAAARPSAAAGTADARIDRLHPYFVEDVRKMLEQKYGADALYEAGLRVQTTLDADLQKVANTAIDRGLRPHRQTSQRVSSAPPRNVVAEGHDIDRLHDRRAGRSRCSPETSFPPS